MRARVEVNVRRQGRVTGREWPPVKVLKPRWVEGSPDEPLVVAVSAAQIKQALANAPGLSDDNMDTVEFTVLFQEGP